MLKIALLLPILVTAKSYHKVRCNNSGPTLGGFLLINFNASSVIQFVQILASHGMQSSELDILRFLM